MITATSSHTLAIPPSSWVRLAGTLEPRADAVWREAVRIPSGGTGPVIETRDYYMSEGDAEVVLHIDCETPPATESIGTLEVIDNVSNHALTSGPVHIDAQAHGWQRVPIRLAIHGTRGHTVRFRLTAFGNASCALASIDVPVDYGMTVVDLTDALNTFDTHASIFDAHPNERAHRVIAQEVLAALRRGNGK